jgi:hypothetical protein
MNPNSTQHDTTTDTASVLGLRCSWCDKCLRKPVGYPDANDHLAWTHGICRDCSRAVEEDSRRRSVADEWRQPVTDGNLRRRHDSSGGITMQLTVWLTVGVVVSSVLAAIGASRAKRTARRHDLGSVSNQWIVENRAGPRDDGAR